IHGETIKDQERIHAQCKRGRSVDAGDEEDGAQPCIPTTPLPALASHPACVALQNEDADEDAIVITALNVIPFCCHADLLSMPRAHLLAVANTLNAKLPHALQIDVGPTRSDVFIRNSIELLVGLRQNVPQAPKPARSLSLTSGSRMHIPASPASPLAARSRSNFSLGSPEDEADPGAEPPQKRRRVEAPESPCIDYARRITRSQSHRVAPLYTSASPGTPTRVVRTHSQKLPERKPVLQNMHPNVTVSRGRTAARAALRSKSQGVVLTSTPKKRKVPSDADPAMASLIAVATALSSSPRATTSTPRGKNKGASSKKSEYSVDAVEVTFGIDGMTMAVASASEMGIGAE
ncbi:hypothetical protein B0H21DRAFT_750585, partial [Amylocystis lapponica]